MINSKKIFITSLVILSFVFYFTLTKPVKSDNTQNVSGYAWNADTSGSGMGWLSFNCISDGSCGNSSYGINIDGSGNMTGYAWSSNFGWIQFGGLSGFPSSPGTIAANATENLTNGDVTGWARFCSVFQSGCSGPLLADQYLGGWDGWISLGNPSLGYGVTVSPTTGAFSGYAWGGGTNLGWINFQNVLTNVIINHCTIGSNCGGCVGSGCNPNNGNQLTLTPSSYVAYTSPYQTTITWNSSIPVTGCVATSIPSDSSWNGPVPTADPSWTGLSYSQTVNIPASPTEYELTCDNISYSEKVTAAPVYYSQGTLTESINNVQYTGIISPQCSGSAGVGSGTTTISWDTSDTVANSCYITSSSGWNSGPETSTPAGSQDGSYSVSGVPVPITSTTYAITCTGFSSKGSISPPVPLTLNASDCSSSTFNKQPYYIEK